MSTTVIIMVSVLVLASAIVAALARVRALNRPRGRLPLAGGADVAGVSEQALSRVGSLVAAGRHADAIQRLRKDAGLNLRQAKQVVDALRTRDAAGAEHAGPTPAEAGSDSPRPRLPADTRREIADLVHAGRKIQAIKLVRQRLGVDLADAKDIVDATVGHDGSHPPQPPTSPAPATTRPDLAQRARRLARQQRSGEAIELVAAETGMSLVDAARFVESLAD